MNLRLELVLALKAQQGKAWVFFLISCVMPRIRCSPPSRHTPMCTHTEEREREREKGRETEREGGREREDRAKNLSLAVSFPKSFGMTT